MGLNLSTLVSKNKIISKVDSIVDKWLGKDTSTTYETAPIYSIPTGITDKPDSTYMILYIYDDNSNSLSFLPMEAEKASSDIWKSFLSCVDLRFSDEWKDGLKNYEKTVISNLKSFIKSNLGINLGSWSDTDVGWVYQNVKDSIKWTSGWIERNISLSSLVDNIGLGSWFSKAGLTSPVELSIDSEELSDLVNKRIQKYAEELSEKYKVFNRLYHKYFDSTTDSGETNSFKIKASIAFPLPVDNVRYSQNIDINQTSTQTASAVMAVLDDTKNAYKIDRSTGKSMLSSGISALVNGAVTAYGEAKGAAKETLYKMFFGDGGEALFQGRNERIRDPMYVYMYKSPTSRDFSFKFVFAPTTKSELYQIWNAIKMIRFYGTVEASTGKGAVKYYNLPGRFKIVYYTNKDENVWFGKTKMMGLTDITTNIPLDDFSLISNDFDDTGNPPRIIELSMSFKELSVVTRQDVNGGY